MFGKSLLSLLTLITLGFSSTEIELKKELKNIMYETTNMIYQNIDQIPPKYSSIYIEVSENKDYEISYMVGDKDLSKSKYTLIGVRLLTPHKNQKLFLISLTKDGKFMLKDKEDDTFYEEILTKNDILSKQDFLIKIFKEYQNELQRRIDIKNNERNKIKDKFLKE